MKKIFATLVSLLLLVTSSAMAEKISLDGTVVSVETLAILSPTDNTIAEVNVQAGEHVEANTVLAVSQSSYVCAEQSGTVTLYGTEGDSVAALITRYGAVANIEPDVRYTISASTRNGYDAIENQLVHNGEQVYLRSIADSTHTGLGVVYGVSGTDFSVEVTSGSFDIGENANIYRGTAAVGENRIGRGSIARMDPVSYTGSETGTVGKLHVANGEHVEKGDVLYELVSNTPASMEAYASGMIAPVSGVVSEISISAGDAVTQGSVVAKLYPDTAMRLEVATSESDLGSMQVGNQVSIQFASGLITTGEVERISCTASQSTDDSDTSATYAVYVTFPQDEAIRYGMTATVITGETEAAANE